MVGTPGWRVESFMASAQAAAVPWANATTVSDGVPDFDEEAQAQEGYAVDWEKVLMKPFFTATYDVVTLSGWGVTLVRVAPLPRPMCVGIVWAAHACIDAILTGTV